MSRKRQRLTRTQTKSIHNKTFTTHTTIFINKQPKHPKKNSLFAKELMGTSGENYATYIQKINPKEKSHTLNQVPLPRTRGYNK